MDGYPVGEVARLARISVRTRRHYDGIGLLAPSARSAGGYRLYLDADLHQLRRIRFWRPVCTGLRTTSGWQGTRAGRGCGRLPIGRARRSGLALAARAGSG